MSDIPGIRASSALHGATEGERPVARRVDEAGRPLGYWEAMLQITRDTLAGSGTFVGVFALEGRCDPERLAGAWAQLHARHAVLRVRVSQTPASLEWTVGAEARGAVFEALERPVALEDLGQLGLADRFAHDAPQWRVRLAPRPHPEGGWGLCVSANHGMLDGRSVICLLAEAIALYDGARPGPPTDMPPPVDAVLSASREGPAAGPGDGAEAVATPRPAPFERACPVADRRAVVRLETLDRAETARVVAAAGALGSSVNSLLAAALMASVVDGAPAELCMGTAVDFRRLTRPPMSPHVVGSFAGVLATAQRVDPADAVGAARLYEARLRASMQRQRAQGFFPDDWAPADAEEVVRATQRRIEGSGSFGTEVALSNLGRIDAPLAGRDFEVREAYVATSLVDGLLGFALTSATLNGRLHLSWSFTEPLLSEVTVARRRARFRRLLAGFSPEADTGRPELPGPSCVDRGFTAVVIGQGVLTRLCAEAFTARGGAVVALATDDAELRGWARGEGWPVVEAIDDLRRSVGRGSVDYVLSVANRYILPDDVLRMARRLAVNFHDGPLPRYAGSHATSWALLAGEQTHGVTWHVMEPRVDAGDILARATVAIPPETTAHGLDLACVQAGLRAFGEWLDADLAGRSVRTPQPAEGRTFFRRGRRPVGGAVVSWVSAAAVERLTRALDLGPCVHHALGRARVLLPVGVACAGRARALESDPRDAPGTVLAVEPALTVVTADGALCLDGLTTVFGEPLGPGQLGHRHGVVVGERLPGLPGAVQRWLHLRVEDMAAVEDHWRRRLRDVEWTAPPLSPRRRDRQGQHSARVFVPGQAAAALAARLDRPPERILMAALVAWLQRTAGGERLDVAFAPAPVAGVDGLEPGDARLARRCVAGWVADWVPLRVAPGAMADVRQLVEELDCALEDTLGPGWLWDLVARAPELRDRRATLSAPPPLVIGERRPSRRLMGATFCAFAGQGPWPGDRTGPGLWLTAPGDRVPAHTMAAVAEQLEHIVEQWARDASMPLDRLELVVPSARRALEDWNGRVAESCADPTAETAITRGLLGRPDRAAIIFDGEATSARTLAARRDHVARSLAARGAVPGEPVVLLVPRGPWIVSGMLGIWAVGGCYVPLDPAYPAERLATIARDVEARLVVTVAAHVETARALGAAPECIVVADGPSPAAQPVEPRPAQPDELAYILYTSGSTGRPKGVEISHGALANVLRAMARTPGLTPHGAMLSLTSMSFDISGVEYHLPLLVGCPLYLATDREAHDPRALAALVAGVDIGDPADGSHVFMQATPATWQMLVDSGWCGDRRVCAISGGEALPPRLARQLVARVGALWNLYGPTEATIWATAHRVDPIVADDRSIPLGRPLPDTRAWVLDRDGRLLPRGVIGELALAGAGLARGYRNRPELTAERFVFGPALGQRVYRTGDRAAWHADGTLEFFGRLDHQIKLRGFRIEPAEIERWLTTAAGVDEALVTVGQRGDADRVLVAYLVGADGVDEAELRRRLERHLPRYMVPDRWVWLDRLPLTPNGKVDRRALPDPWSPAARATPPATPRRAPADRDPGEARLAALWARMLRRADIDPDQHFFELGGHSLLLVRMQAALRDGWGVSLPMGELLAHPTVRALARRLGELTAPDSASPPPAAPTDAAGAERAPAAQGASDTAERIQVAVSPGQLQMWLLDQTVTDRATYNVGFQLHFAAEPDSTAVRRALAEIVRRHAPLRTVYRARDGRVEARVRPPGPVDVALTELGHLPPGARREQAYLVGRAHLRQPVDLETGPVYRFRLLTVNPGDHRLLVLVHHIAFDAWSVDVFRREFAALYRRLTGRGDAPPLEPLATDYPAFAERAAGRAQTDAHREQLAWWTGHLRDLPPLSLPADRSAGVHRDNRGAWFSFELEPAVWRRLRAAGQARRCSAHQTLLALVAIWLHRLSDQDDFAIGVPVTVRDRSAEHALIGDFVNMLPWRCAHRDARAFADVLDAVHAESRAVLDARLVPFADIVRAVGGERSAGDPVFQVAFTLDQLSEVSEGLTTELLAEPHGFSVPDNGTAKLDLTVRARVERDALSIGLEYRRALFEPSSIERFARCLSTLAAALAERPDTPWRSIDIRPAAMREAMARLGGPARVEPPLVDPSRRIAGHGEDRPDDVAVRHGAHTLTYAELNRLADHVAERLRRWQIGPGDRIALCAPHTPRAVATLLGIWRAGAAYVPIDPRLPLERIRFIAADAQARLVVVEDDDLPVSTGIAEHVLSLGAMLSARSPRAEDAAIGRGRQGGDAAYVIYTSGSTGVPKGVIVDDRALGILVGWHIAAFELRPGTRVSLFAGPAFDASVWELWPALAAGACVDIVPPERRVSPAGLRDWLVQRAIDYAFVPTPMAERLLELEWPPETPLRALLTGGGRLTVWPPSDLPFELHNFYGPTEATVVATGGRIPEEMLGSTRLPPIGRPLPHVCIRVVDRHGLDAPFGAPGELWIGGPTVARGYLGRPELTAEAFVEGVDGAGRPCRWYRTGDRVRWRPDGDLEFIERVDLQVQIRGHRVELGEIELAIVRSPGVEQAVVVARRGPTGEPSLIAFVIAAADVRLSTVRRAVACQLPDHMVPARFVRLDALPLNANGKVDRDALEAPELPDEVGPPHGATERAVAGIWSELLGLRSVGRDRSFFDIGGHSLLLASVRAAIDARFDLLLPIVELMRYPTVRALAARIDAGGHAERARPSGAAVEGAAGRQAAGDALAVVGMAGRFPGAPDVDALWRLIEGGGQGISRFDAERLAAVDPAALDDPCYVPASGHLSEPDGFDAGFFDCPPAEARLLDPQHRLLLECGWSALEDAGIDPARTPGRISVFAGAGAPRYWLERAGPATRGDGIGAWRALTANAADFAATRLAYAIGLSGPAVGVQTGCSTSLVAIHLACRSLRHGECDVALAGGVSLHGIDPCGYHYREGMILSPDGHCRPFDADAAGTVPGSGVGVVVLRRLADAVADGDHIYAVVRGSAINNDGSHKLGFTAPSVDGQRAVLEMAYADAGVSPASVGFVEAHGTGTALGDPIEFAALDAVFSQAGARAGACALGALKANLGHLDAAAGVAGFIKACLVVQRGVIPPLTHFRAANPALSLEGSPFEVPRARRDWQPAAAPRRAGVTALGIGGTNAHVVVEQAPAPGAGQPDGRWQLLPLSARSEAALERLCDRLAGYLEAHPDADIADVAATLQLGRAALPVRRFVVGRDARDLARALAARDPGAVGPTREAAESPSVAFLLPGSGSQFLGMGAGLRRAEPVFAAAFGAMSSRVADVAGWSMDAALDGRDGTDWLDPARFMPLIVATEIALGRLLMAWGVTPDALLGHSLGEIAAAALSGVLDDGDAVELAAHRGAVCAEVEPGAMLSVLASPSAIDAWLTDGLDLAVVNGASCVIAGPAAAIGELRQALSRRGIVGHLLDTRFPAHCRLVEPVMQPLAARAARLPHRPGRIPYVSNISGGWHAPEEPVDGHYWALHLRAPARFDLGLSTLLSADPDVLVEVGPGRTLAGLVRRHPSSQGRPVIPTVPGDEECRLGLLWAAGRLWTMGVELDWRALHRGARRTVPLPTYPFERVRHRLPLATSMATPGRTAPTGPEGGPEPLAGVRLSAPCWVPEPLDAGPDAAVAAPLGDPTWVVSAGASSSRALASALIEGMRAIGAPASLLAMHARPARAPTTSEAADPVGPLVRALREQAPDRVVVVWSDEGDRRSVDGVAEAVHTAVSVLRALTAQTDRPPRRIDWITPAAARRGGPAGASVSEPVASAVRVIAQETPQTAIRVLHVDAGVEAASVVEWLRRPTGAAVSRLTPRGLRVPGRRPVAGGPGGLRPAPGGVYLITGGTGGLGLALTAHLTETHGARVALLARTATRGPHAAEVRALVQRGARIVCLDADVTCAEDVEGAIARLRALWGDVDGVVHAAGVFDIDRAHRFDRPRIRRVLAAKLEGVERVLHALADRPPAFVALCGSTSALDGGLGLAPYAAANAALGLRGEGDAGRDAVRWVTIEWCGLEVGGVRSPGARLADAFEGIYRAARGPRLPAAAIGPVFEAALASGAGRVRIDIEPAPTGGRPTADGSPPAPAPVLAAVRDAWAQCIGDPPSAAEVGFFASGGTSLLAIQLVDRVNARLGARVSLARFLDDDTFGALARLALRRGPPGAEPSDPPVVQLGEARGGRPLFLFPPAVGSLLAYRALAAEIGGRLPLVGVPLPGVDGQGASATDLDALVSALEEAVVEVQPRGPYRLGGSSMGGVLAYEVARRLHRRGEAVEQVSMFDSPGPGDIDASLTDEAAIRRYLGAMAPDLLRTIDDLRGASAPRGVAVDPAHFFDAFAAHCRLLSRYSTAPWPGRIHFYRAEIRDPVNPERPEARWIGLAGEVEVEVVPGNHITMLDAPHVGYLAERLVRRLGPPTPTPTEGRDP